MRSLSTYLRRFNPNRLTICEETAQSSMDVNIEGKRSKRRHLGKVADGLNNEALSNNRAPPRYWLVTKNASDEEERPSAIFRACTYNILSQNCMQIHKYLYRHLSAFIIPWSERWNQMSRELSNIDSDIYALQEVEESIYQDDLHPFFAKGYYDTMFTKKTSIANPDGCMLAWNKKVFECVQKVDVSYQRKGNKLMAFPQIGQIVVLRCRRTQELLVVANTHILFNMNRGDTKIAQMAILFAHIHEVRSRFQEKTSLLLMGDFNMEPRSACYQYVVKAKINVNGRHHSKLATQDTIEGPQAPVFAEHILPMGDPVCRDGMFLVIDGKEIHRQLEPHTFTHPLNLQSVYDHSQENSHEVSTYHADSGNPDFMFYNVAEKSQEGENKSIETHNLKLLSRYSLPSHRDLQGLNKWPNAYVPSDHIPLIANFQLSSDFQLPSFAPK